ncbi:MAG TPA: hypothetical protein VGA33_11645 [Thermoanaerobaculia bacterium]
MTLLTIQSPGCAEKLIVLPRTLHPVHFVDRPIRVQKWGEDQRRDANTNRDARQRRPNDQNRDRDCDRSEQQVVDVREAVEEKCCSEERRTRPRTTARVVQERSKQQWKRAALHVLYVRKMGETERHKSVEDAGGDAGQTAAGDQAAEEPGGIAGEGESAQHRQVVRRDRGDSGRTKGKKKNRDAEEVLAVRQRVARGIENIRIK